LITVDNCLQMFGKPNNEESKIRKSEFFSCEVLV